MYNSSIQLRVSREIPTETMRTTELSNMLKQLCLRFKVLQIPAHYQKDEVLFEACDRNHNGFVTLEEVIEFIRDQLHWEEQCKEYKMAPEEAVQVMDSTLKAYKQAQPNGEMMQGWSHFERLCASSEALVGPYCAVINTSDPNTNNLTVLTKEMLQALQDYERNEAAKNVKEVAQVNE